MQDLNYHHLRYFVEVARQGSIARASRRLHISPPSISVQLQKLEDQLGEQLLVKQGRGLRLTETGEMVRNYAERIFALGTEMLDAVQQHGERPARLRIGVDDAVPKELAVRLLEPVFADSTRPTRSIVHEGEADRLLADLALHHFDLVLLDEPPPAIARLKIFQHPLGKAHVGVFSSRKQDVPRRKRFPASLADAPFILPVEHSLLRREFDDFCQRESLAIRVVAECEDSSFAKTLARDGRGMLLAPTVLAPAMRKHYGLEHIGELDGVRIPYVACTAARRIDNPFLKLVLERARTLLSE
ncbi:MAG: LysR family transcriptional regulator [Planctomycetota bacterium]